MRYYCGYKEPCLLSIIIDLLDLKVSANKIYYVYDIIMYNAMHSTTRAGEKAGTPDEKY